MHLDVKCGEGENLMPSKNCLNEFDSEVSGMSSIKIHFKTGEVTI